MQLAPPDVSTTTIYTFNVNTLTANITPVPPYGAGIYISYLGADQPDAHDEYVTGDNGSPGGPSKNLTLTYDGGTHLISSSTAAQGMYLYSKGGKGGDGGNGTAGLLPGLGGNGGNGAAGGVLMLNSQGAIQVSSGTGIYVQSTGGAGGRGGNGDAASYGEGGYGGTGGAGGQINLISGSNITSGGPGIRAASTGGAGGGGGNGGGSDGVGGAGHAGGAGGQVEVTNTGTITTQNNHSIQALSYGGAGGTGGEADGIGGKGGAGGSGGAGGPVKIITQGNIAAQGYLNNGIYVESSGGNGGTGGRCDSGTYSKGGNGGLGGSGNAAVVDSSSNIIASGEGIVANSHGGAGGNGGQGGGTDGEGGTGNIGGAGGQVTVTSKGSITTAEGDGILAWSRGGAGGRGGDGNGISGIGHDGGSGGSSGAVNVTNEGAIQIQGENFHGIYAFNQAGMGGDGGDGKGVGGKGGGGGVGGDAGAVSVVNHAGITTPGEQSQGILAQSLGGAGGSGGDGDGVVGVSGAVKGSGDGGLVTVTSSGAIQTAGGTSRGIFAQSVGGFAGSGGFAGGLLAFGADGNSGGAGGGVTVSNTGNITTVGKSSEAVFAQSVGGGGGSGGSTGGLFSMGGTGNAGGLGGAVSVTNSGKLQTSSEGAEGIFAQSVGGGGGDGGASISGGIGFSVALGGSAGTGGTGGAVSVNSSNAIDTAGMNASGIHAQSTGGGGGSGGYAFSAAVGVPISSSVALGGSGGDGGNGSTVTVNSTSVIHTLADNAYGIFAESLGGGGGSGGFSFAASAAPSYSAAVSLGGSGDTGGSAQKVTVTTTGGAITTAGANADGILAQSVGGGGGAGGFSVSGSLGTVSAGVSLGGSGGKGGSGGEIAVSNDSDILTSGKMASGLLAQSVGGGGGAGGFSIAASAGMTSSAVGLGGSGGTGGSGGLVGVTNSADISTAGELAYGLLAQSVGGGGGFGGYSLSAGVGVATLDFAFGGSGTAGGAGGMVNLSNTGVIATHAKGSYGILAQSVGGGGGAGGWAGTGAISFGIQAGDITIPSLSLAVALGGEGGPGSYAQKVNVHNAGSITTDQEGSGGILAQSIGGGGGDAGWAMAAALNISVGKTAGAAISVAHGGTGGSGGNGGEVAVSNEGATQTTAKNAPGILAQSVGGGGGNGGASAAITVEAATESATTFNGSVSIGGKAGGGGAASLVTVNSSAPVTTSGDGSQGILAQSVGGGGGNGGLSVSGTVGLTTSANQLAMSVGGTGGLGGNAGLVTLSSTGNVSTHGNQATGLLAQSIGGGGGNGGLSFDGNLSINESNNLSLSVGGSGGTAGNGNSVQVAAGGAISTAGSDAHGIFAQSVGGGGGAGNMGGSGKIIFQAGEEEQKSVNMAVNIGGSGGAAGIGGTVDLDNLADIATAGTKSYGIFAQSVGGGGGAAGGGFTGTFSTTLPESGECYGLNMTIGGEGGSGNYGGIVNVDNQGDIATLNDKSHGIFAQSVGGGGGAGGDASVYTWEIGEPEVLPEGFNTLEISVGGGGGNASYGGAVTVNNVGAVSTGGDYAKGIFGQSVGGGGGVGGSVGGEFIRTSVIPGTVGITVGGDGGGSSNGGNVGITNSGAITTTGVGSYGIQAQSVGAGGGEGGEGEVGLLLPNIGIGGAAGAAGQGGAVTVVNSGVINTAGDGAHGIMAQSVGGGGGIAGNVGRLPIYESEGEGEEEGITVDIGIGFGWARDGGAGGNGGQVSVTNSADITTRGVSAYGIFAQSVGGGGGEAGEVGYGPGTGLNYLLGSVGDAGSGGAVSVNHTGNITLYGTDSVGIFAQSAGGEGTGGAVTVAVAGNVVSLAEDAIGILAQSVGLGGSGNIAVTVNSGTVMGGYGGTGVVFMDGAENTLTNRGTISTADKTAGTAIRQIASEEASRLGNLTINNYGTIIGSVAQNVPAGSAINVTNQATAILDTGTSLDLGSGTLTNDGIVNLGGSSTAQTNLTGNFTQTSTGVLHATLNGDGTGDSLRVSGTATLAGSLKAELGIGAFRNGATYSLITAGQGITSRFTTVELQGTPLLKFSTNVQGNEMQVVSDVRNFTTVAGTPHHWVLGENLDILLPVTSGEFNQVLRVFQTMHESNYERGFESLSPGIYDANTFTTFNVIRQYHKTLQQRLQVVRENLVSPPNAQAKTALPVRLAYNGSTQQLLAGSQGESLYRRLGVSLQGFGQWGDQDKEDGFSGYDYSMGGVTIGLDYGVSDKLAVGANFGYADTSLDQDNNFADGSFDSYYGSLYSTYVNDRVYLEGILTYGSHDYDNDRLIRIDSIQGRVVSDHDGDSFSAFVEGGYAIPVQEWVVQPLVSLLYAVLDEDGFEETGAGALNMHVGSRKTDSLVSEAGLRVSRPITTSMGILVPALKATWQHDFDIDDNKLPISFAGAPVGLTVDGRDTGEDSAVLNGGLSLTCPGGITTSLQYEAVLGDGYTAQSLMGQIRLTF